jgi:hypothetical protein
MTRYTKEFKLTLTTSNGVVAEEVIDLDELGYGYGEWEWLTDGEKEDVLNDYLQSWIFEATKPDWQELPEPNQAPPNAKYEPTTLDYDVYGVAAFVI